jgi:hypothetical protein
MKAECVVPSCCARQEANYQRLCQDGWRKLKETTERNPPAARRWKTHLGWCPVCVAKFSVKADA